MGIKLNENKMPRYRGKTIKDGKWVEGYYYKKAAPIQCIGESTEEPKSFICHSDWADWNMPRIMLMHEVEPDSVEMVWDGYGEALLDGFVVCNKDGSLVDVYELAKDVGLVDGPFKCVVSDDGGLYLMNECGECKELNADEYVVKYSNLD